MFCYALFGKTARRSVVIWDGLEDRESMTSDDGQQTGAASDIARKMREDWDRRAHVDPKYWVAATAEADDASYQESAVKDAAALLEGLTDEVGPGARVLDLGCGIGRLSAELAGRFTEVVGGDVSPEMIAVARRMHADKPGLRFESNSGVDLADFEDGAFAMVFSYSVLPHIPPDVLEGYFLEIGRVLRPGGLFRFQFWIGDAHPAAEADTLSIRTYRRADVDRMAADGGLEVQSTDTIDYFDPVLKMHPVWVNARKVGSPTRLVTPPAPREAGARVPAEQELEYGLLLYLAVKHGERGELQDAERVIEQALALDPSRPEAYVQWATWRIEADDVKGAVKLIEVMNQRVPDSTHGWLYRAQFCEAMGDLRTAERALDKLAALKPTDPELLEQATALRKRLRAL